MKIVRRNKKSIFDLIEMYKGKSIFIDPSKLNEYDLAIAKELFAHFYKDLHLASNKAIALHIHLDGSCHGNWIWGKIKPIDCIQIDLSIFDLK